MSKVFDPIRARSSVDALEMLCRSHPECAVNVTVLREELDAADEQISQLARALRAEVEGPAPKHVGWLTQAGNVVTPVGHREQDARMYGWRPVYVLAHVSGVMGSAEGDAVEAACRAKFPGWDNPRYFGEYAKELRRGEMRRALDTLGVLGMDHEVKRPETLPSSQEGGEDMGK